MRGEGRKPVCGAFVSRGSRGRQLGLDRWMPVWSTLPPPPPPPHPGGRPEPAPLSHGVMALLRAT